MAQVGTGSSLLMGIEIGGTKLQMVLGDVTGKILQRWRCSADRDAGGAGICRQIEQGMRELSSHGKPAAVGVGFGGPVDFCSGRINKSHHVKGWEGFALGPWLSGVVGVPVAVDNDSDIATLGEAHCGAGQGLDPVFYFNAGSGVGGGLVCRGEIYHGASPGEAEFGHLLLDRKGTTIESRCSGWAVDARIRQIQNRHPQSLLAQLSAPLTALGKGGEARVLGQAAERKDAAALELLGELADDFAFGLSHVVQLFHPQIIVFGGGLSLVGEVLRAAIAAALPQYVMDSFRPGPQVRLAALGEDVVPVGALCLARMAAKL